MSQYFSAPWHYNLLSHGGCKLLLLISTVSVWYVFFSPKRSKVWRNILWAHLVISIYYFVLLLAICLVKCFYTAVSEPHFWVKKRNKRKKERPISLTHDVVETLKHVTGIAISWCLSKSLHTTFAVILSKISLILCQGWLLSFTWSSKKILCMAFFLYSLTCTSFGELHAINKCWRR